MIFRKEVIDAHRHRLTGKIIINQDISRYFLSSILFVIFLIVVIYLSQCGYSRKETVKGYLSPSKGVVKVVSGRKGVLIKLLVKDGSYIEKGQPIAKIQDSQGITKGVEVSLAFKRELKKQLKALDQELITQNSIFKKEKKRTTAELSQLEESYKAIQKVKTTSLLRLQLKKQQYDKNQTLQQKGYLSTTQLAVIQGEYLEVLESVERLDKELTSVKVQINAIKSTIDALPDQQTLKVTTLHRQISQIQTQLIERDNEYESIITAPESGTVTAIQPFEGAHLNAETLILSIIPNDSPLQIELLLPSRSAGFTQVGDEVKIRFDAFPYQKFGLVKGNVINIDQALVLPSEAIFPIKITEPMYRVKASLTTQSIMAYGKSFPLKTGMIAEADIIQEKRSLMEWLLDPIYAIKGKLG
jgi:membrane fusion protein